MSRFNGSNGNKGGGSSNLGGLTDVSLGTLTDGHVLTYESSTSKWKPKPPSGGSSNGATYVIELSRWGINNDGTNAINTTKGINDALAWAFAQGYSYVKLPTGSYTIAKGTVEGDKSNTAVLTLQSNMTLDLLGCTITKETNSYRTYYAVYGKDIKNSKVIGGIIQGDKDNHSYSDASSIYEWCEGAYLEGKLNNITFEGVEFKDFPGYSLATFGSQYQFALLTSASIEAGDIDGSGNGVTTDNFVRTKSYYTLSTYSTWINPLGYFMITGNGYNSYGFRTDGSPVNLTNTVFNIHCFNDANAYLGKVQRKSFEPVNIDRFPTGTTKFKISFRYEYLKIIPNTFYLGLDARQLSSNIKILNCKFHDSYALGIALSQSTNTVIEGCEFYNIGYSTQKVGRKLYPFPMGIDIEDGYSANQNITIKNNIFRDNEALHINVVQARNVLVEGNKFSGTGGIVFQGTKGSNLISRGNEYNSTGATGESCTFVEFQDDVMTNASIQLRTECRYVGCSFVDMNFVVQVDVPANYSTAQPYALGGTVLPTTKNGYYYVCTTASGVKPTAEPTWTTSGTTTDSVGNVWTVYKYNPDYDLFTFEKCKFNHNKPETTEGFLIRRGRLLFDACKLNINSARYFTDNTATNDYALKSEIEFRDTDIKVIDGAIGAIQVANKVTFLRSKIEGNHDNVYNQNSFSANFLRIEDSILDSVPFVIGAYSGANTGGICLIKNNTIIVDKSARRFGNTTEGLYLQTFDTMIIEDNLIRLPLSNVDLRPMTIRAEKYLKLTGNTAISNNTNNNLELFDAYRTDATPIPVTNAIIDNNNFTKLYIKQDITFITQCKKILGDVYTNMDAVTKGSADSVSAIPTSGRYYTSQMIYNSAPISGGYAGWICTTGGVANGNAWATTTTYAVNALINANGKVYKCTVAGNSGATAPSHTTGTAVDGTVTWQYIDTLAVFKPYGLIG